MPMMFPILCYLARTIRALAGLDIADSLKTRKG